MASKRETACRLTEAESRMKDQVLCIYPMVRAPPAAAAKSQQIRAALARHAVCLPWAMLTWGFFSSNSIFHADVTGRSYGAHQLASRGRAKVAAQCHRRWYDVGTGGTFQGVASYTVCEFSAVAIGLLWFAGGVEQRRRGEEMDAVLGPEFAQDKSGRALNGWIAARARSGKWEDASIASSVSLVGAATVHRSRQYEYSPPTAAVRELEQRQVPR
ncbi:hypothetical protein V8C42DRAFT_231505 [Trichoderma barbatum]